MRAITYSRTSANPRHGFTIVELLIVIVVIGILAAITIVSFNGVQQKARDTERKSDIGQFHKALELFYAENNYYPSVNDVLSTSFRTNTLNIPTAIATPPGQTGVISYCWSSSFNSYCYVGLPAAGGSFDCNVVGEKCLGYTLSYRLESDPNNRVDRRSIVWP